MNQISRVNSGRAAMLLAFALPASVFAQWPQFGGPNRDFKSDATGLAEKWSDDGPRPIWSRSLGEGYSSIVMDGGRLFTMYRSSDKEIVVALDAGTGETIWEQEYEAPIAEGIEKRFGVGPRSTPTIAADHVYAIGITGKLSCLTKKDGKLVWSHDLMREFGAKAPEFGFASSPIVYGNTLIAAVGGKGSGMMAFDLMSGSVIWQRHDFENTYSSPMVIDVDGQDQVVLLVDREIVAIDPTNGDVIWRHEHVNQWKTNISTPVWNGVDLLFVTSGGEGGGRVLKLARKDGKTSLEEVWANRKTGVGQSNVLRVEDHLYGCAGYGPNSFIMAVNLETGKTAWKERGYKSGTMLYADGKLIVLSGDGDLSLIEASPKACTVLSTFKLFEKDSWTVPTLVGQRLYVRNRETIVALDLG